MRFVSVLVASTVLGACSPIKRPVSSDLAAEETNNKNDILLVEDALKRYCRSCHGVNKDLRFMFDGAPVFETIFKTKYVKRNRLWAELILESLERKIMPLGEKKRQFEEETVVEGERRISLRLKIIDVLKTNMQVQVNE